MGVYLGQSEVLTIEPGVVIKFGGWRASFPVIFLIYGKIIAKGTENNPIVFTSIYDDSYNGDSNKDGSATLPEPGNWGTLQIDGDNNIFDHVIMKYGGGDERGLMTFYGNSNQITNSVFENNLRGIVFRSSSSTNPSVIENNMFINNKGGALSFLKSANPVVRYNNIYNNGGGIGVSGLAAPIINYNNIYNNNGYGVHVNQCYSSNQSVDAKFNWWGHESGPEHADNNPGGTGSKVSDRIDFSNWLLNMHE